uniref:Uncharacterized protein n=1 Tax=Chelonoidis abingdonii TaxID=106734 RepID=A0A8C0HB59_CHEAB
TSQCAEELSDYGFNSYHPSSSVGLPTSSTLSLPTAPPIGPEGLFSMWQMTEQGAMVSSCSGGGPGWILGNTISLGGW